MKNPDQETRPSAKPALNFIAAFFGLMMVGLIVFAWSSLSPRMPATGSVPSDSMAGMNMGSPNSQLAQLEGDLHALIVDQDGNLFYGQHAGVQISRDGGQTWSTAAGGGDAMGMGVKSGKVFLAGHDFFAISTDSGQTWNKPGVGNLPGTDIHGFAVADNGWLYANLAGGGLYRSTDDGANWTYVTQAITRAYKIVAATGVPPVLYALTQDQGLVRSSNGGTTWKQIKVNGQPLTIAVEASGAISISLSDSTVLRSSDGGTTWKQSKAPEAFVLLAVNPKNSKHLYGVSDTGQVYASRDAGETWVGR